MKKIILSMLLIWNSFASSMDYSLGSVKVTHESVKVDADSYINPIIIAGVPSNNDKSAGVVSVSISSNRIAEIKFIEWDTTDINHGEEEVPYLIVEQGRYQLEDGIIIEAGQIDLNKNNKTIFFNESFPQVPKLILSPATNNLGYAFNLRATNLTRSSYQVILDKAENNHTPFVPEKVNYLAIYTNGTSVKFPDDQNALVYTELVNEFGIDTYEQHLFIQEEQTSDVEVKHVFESVSILNFNGQLFASANTNYGGDTFSFRNESQYPDYHFTPGDKTGDYDNIALNGTNQLTVGNYFASSFWSSYTAASAFDGYNKSTKINHDSKGIVGSGAWLAYHYNRQDLPQWLEVMFDKRAFITGFSLHTYEAARVANMGAKKVTLQVSDDNIDYKDHESFTLENINQNNITLNRPAIGKYIRLVVHSTQGHNVIVIGELEYYGKFIINEEITPPNADAITCASILADAPNSPDGTYYVDPLGRGGDSGFNVYCNMSSLDGGWALFANHQDALDNLVMLDIITQNTLGVIQDSSWRSLRNTMQVGIMTIDENGKIAYINKNKLNNSRCLNLNRTDSLKHPPVPFDVAYLWHDEVNGCSSYGLDYSYISLSTKNTSRQNSHLTVGASLYQHATKFDVWPYSDQRYSGSEQNQLKMYIK